MENIHAPCHQRQEFDCVKTDMKFERKSVQVMTNGSQSTAVKGRAKKIFALRHETREVQDLASELERRPRSRSASSGVKVIGSSEQEHVVDALAMIGEERRGSLRKASGSWQTSIDPEVSEWGNPPARVSLPEYIGQGGKPGELNHLSTLRKRHQPRFPE